MTMHLHRPPAEMVAQHKLFSALEKSLVTGRRELGNSLPIDHQIELFCDCIFYEHRVLGLCRDSGQTSPMVRHVQARNLIDLQTEIAAICGRTVSVFELIESCHQVKAPSFPVLTARVVFDWFLSEVVSGAGFSQSDEEEVFNYIDGVLGPHSNEIDLADCTMVTVATINRLNACPIMSGFFSYALFCRHTLPFKIQLKEFLDKLFIACLDEPF